MAKKPSPKDLQSFRDTLMRARAALTGDMTQLQEEALGNGRGASESRPGDTSDGYYQEFNLELLERDETTLREILEALDRIDVGTYGQCESCASWIPKERLRAVPHARHCVDCQRKIEQRGW